MICAQYGFYEPSPRSLRNVSLYGARSRHCYDYPHGSMCISPFYPHFRSLPPQGMFGDKDATIQRFKEVYTTRLSDDIKARLVLENDEVRPNVDSLCSGSVTYKRPQMCYNADDLLPVCEELNIPIVVSRPPRRPPHPTLTRTPSSTTTTTGYS